MKNCPPPKGLNKVPESELEAVENKEEIQHDPRTLFSPHRP